MPKHTKDLDIDMNIDLRHPINIGRVVQYEELGELADMFKGKVTIRRVTVTVQDDEGTEATVIVESEDYHE